MKPIILILLSFFLRTEISFAAQSELPPPGVMAQFNHIKSDSGRIDFITNYVSTNYIGKKSITGSQALYLLNLAEAHITKSTTTIRQYTVYNQLFKVHTALKNERKASAYQKKAAILNIGLGDLKQKEIDQKDKTIEKQIGSLSQLGKENAKQGKIIEQTTEELAMEKIERENKEAQLKVIQQEKAIQDLQLQQKQKQNSIYFLLIILFMVISVTVIFMFLNNKRFSRKLGAQNVLLAIEKKRSDDLLLNILPQELAEELKMNGESEARSHEAVTIMFTDFVDFTRLSEQMSPRNLVHEIDYCFKAFDRIIAKYGIEKIKTVGDAYLCACGVPTADKQHALNVIDAAIEIRDFMARLKEERADSGVLAFQVRIGIHSGPLVAGIVGIKKFAYDIWGDAVNIASRMETSSEPGMINVSEDTYQLAKENFYFKHRGKIEAKNKGLIDMYFVEKKMEKNSGLMESIPVLMDESSSPVNS